MYMEIANPLLQLLNHRQIPKDYLIGWISGIAWEIITSDRCVDEFNQIMKAVGTPGVARAIITLSRIMLQIKVENHVIMQMKITNPLLQLLNHRQIPKDYLIGWISGIAWEIITFSKMMLLMKIKLR